MSITSDVLNRVRVGGTRACLQVAEAASAFGQTIYVGPWTESIANDLEQFRYDIYVGELHKRLPGASHTQRRLKDEHDCTATHFVVKDAAGSIVGCVRLHMSPLIPKTLLEDLGLVRFVEQYDRPFGYVSKLMVARSHRGAGIAIRLMKAMVEYGHNKPYNGEVAFFHCHPKLVELYQRTGFRRFGSAFHDPHVGTQIPMYIMGGDVEHFAGCSSPMASLARRYALSPERKEHLLSLIPPPKS